MSDDIGAVAAGRSYGGVAPEERLARRRTDLIEAVLDLIADGGPAAVSKRSICARARLNDRYFYEHFANRDAALSAAAEQVTRQGLDAVLAAVLAVGPDPQHQVMAVAEAALSFVSRDPRHIALMLSSSTSESLRGIRVSTQLSIAAALERLARPNDSADSTPDPNLHLVCFATVAGLMDLVEAWLRGDVDTIAREQFIALIASLLWSQLQR